MKLLNTIQHPVRTGIKIAEVVAGKLMPRKTHIFIACFPKSGSTFLSRILAEVCAYRLETFTYRHKRNEQDLYRPAIVDALPFNTVTQQHTRATQPNLELFTLFGIRPVVLTRNIFDIVVSLRDHFHTQGQNAPMLFVDDNFYQQSEELQYDMTIELALPWYINFYVSWHEAQRLGHAHICWASYEELMSDKVATLKSILDFYKLKVSAERIEQLVQRAEERRKATRFNKGISGRGEQLLSVKQKQKIRDYTRFYPWVDFSRMGL